VPWQLSVVRATSMLLLPFVSFVWLAGCGWKVLKGRAASGWWCLFSPPVYGTQVVHLWGQSMRVCRWCTCGERQTEHRPGCVLELACLACGWRWPPEGVALPTEVSGLTAVQPVMPLKLSWVSMNKRLSMDMPAAICIAFTT
jgi:hypothetical protein